MGLELYPGVLPGLAIDQLQDVFLKVLMLSALRWIPGPGVIMRLSTKLNLDEVPNLYAGIID